MPRWVGRELSEIGVLVVIVDAHRRQDRDDDIIVGEVGVEGTAKWEVCRVIRNGAVDAAVACKDVLVVQAGKKFLQVA